MVPGNHEPRMGTLVRLTWLGLRGQFVNETRTMIGHQPPDFERDQAGIHF